MAEWSSRYPYTQANVQKYAPVGGGVYRLINKNGEDYHVFYVGQSDNMERRLLEHLATSEPNPCIKRYLQTNDCFFRFIEISSSYERDRVEQEQIKEYSPGCNT